MKPNAGHIYDGVTSLQGHAIGLAMDRYNGAARQGCRCTEPETLFEHHGHK